MCFCVYSSGIKILLEPSVPSCGKMYTLHCYVPILTLVHPWRFTCMCFSLLITDATL